MKMVHLCAHCGQRVPQPFMVCDPCMNGPDSVGTGELARAWRIIDNAARELADTRIMAALPDDARAVFDGLAWTLGYVAAMIDPHPREETDSDGAHPFGNATERGN